MKEFLDKIIPVALSILTGTLVNLFTEILKEILAKKKKKVKGKRKKRKWHSKGRKPFAIKLFRKYKNTYEE